MQNPVQEEYLARIMNNNKKKLTQFFFLFLKCLSNICRCTSAHYEVRTLQK